MRGSIGPKVKELDGLQNRDKRSIIQKLID